MHLTAKTLLSAIIFIGVLTVCLPGRIQAGDDKRVPKEDDEDAVRKAVEALKKGPERKGPRLEPAGRLDKAGLVRRIDWRNGENNIPGSIIGTLFTPDGNYLGYGDTGPKSGIRMWDIEFGREICEYLPSKPARWSSAILSPDSKCLAATQAGGNAIYVWDIVTGKLRHTLSPRRVAGGANVGIDISSDSKHLLGSSVDGTIHVWELSSGMEVLTLPGSEPSPNARFSSNSLYVVSYSRNTIFVWETKTGLILNQLKGHTDDCTALFTPEGNQVLTFSKDKTIRLWEARSGKELHRFDGHTGAVSGVEFLAGSQRFASWGMDKKLCIWDLNTGKQVEQFDLGADLDERMEVRFTPDCKLVISYHTDKTLRVHQMATFKELHRYEKVDSVFGLSCSADNEYAAAGGLKGAVNLWHLPSTASADRP